MDQKYTYGYINGWNVENEYINSQMAIMNNYNIQKKKLEELNNEIQSMEGNRIRNYGVSEDDIRRWYNEDVVLNNRNQSYESYRNNILRERENILNGTRTTENGNEIQGLNEEIQNKTDEYAANLYYMIEVKEATRNIVRQRRLELESLLEEKRIERERVWLERRRVGVQYDENRRITNSEQLNEFRKMEDQIWLDTRRIEHALRELDEINNSLELTAEELELDRNGLTSKQREYYNKIAKTPNPTFNPRESNNENTITPPSGSENGNDSEPNDSTGEGNEEEKENDEVNQKQSEFEIELDKYNEAFDEYEKHLEEYKENLEKLYKLQNAYENDKIKYSEYNEFADFVKEEYNKILVEYNQLKEMYDRLKELLKDLNALDALTLEELTNRLKQLEADFKAEYQFRVHNQSGLEENQDDFINDYNEAKKKLEDAIKRKQGKYASLSDEELNRMLQELEAEFNREYQYRVHEENGLNEHEDDFIDNYNRRKKEIEDELKRRGKKYTLREPVEPEKPIIIPEKTKEDIKETEQTTKAYNLESLIYKIAGDYQYRPLDSFIYKNKEIKCFNWNKKKERSLLDKPIKLVKTGISTIILTGSKLFAKGAYLRKDVRERINYCLDNIEKLTDEEVDYLFENLTATKMKELQNILPDIAWTALYRKFVKRAHMKVNLANNQLKLHYLTIVSLYKKSKQIQLELADKNLPLERRKSLEETLKGISSELCKNIVEYDNIYAKTDNMLNASGLHGISENYRARRTNSVGGRRAKYFDSRVGRGSAGIIGRKMADAINNGDGITAAKYFIYDEQIKIENTQTKRTVKNLFGEASVGIFQFSPLVEQADYSEDDYLRDVLQTVILASSIINMVQQMALREQLIEANKQIQIKNAEIAQLNQDIDTLKGMFSEYTSNPSEFLGKYHTILKNSLGEMQGASEYLGMQAQAGASTSNLVSSGAKYKLFDDYTHDMFGNLDRQIDSIFNSSTISYQDKILQMGKVYEKGVDEIARQAIHHAGDISAHVAKYGGNYDFTSLMSIINTASTVDPSIIANTFNEYVQAAMFVNNMQAISYINSINVGVDLTAATVALAGMVGHGALEEYRAAKKRNPEKFANNDIDEMKEAAISAKIEEHELAKEMYSAAKEEWDSKGFFYKIFHQKDKPKQIDYDWQVVREESERKL